MSGEPAAAGQVIVDGQRIGVMDTLNATATVVYRRDKAGVAPTPGGDPTRPAWFVVYSKPIP